SVFAAASRRTWRMTSTRRIRLSPNGRRAAEVICSRGGGGNRRMPRPPASDQSGSTWKSGFNLYLHGGPGDGGAAMPPARGRSKSNGSELIRAEIRLIVGGFLRESPGPP